ncbi:TorF family putative porin [Accumulibacter sp.]|uniref:TorF family putative porin n=1 Tax=Accumulibacter sp. TaxID=2053492 RepID=UPI002620BEBB|nr:TorF family putative porin [Accumulibacter sp.]
MKNLALATVFCAALSTPAVAQTPDSAQADTVPAGTASPHTLSGNLGLFSSYRFRGIDQTFGKPALQGGFDYAHASGFYVGNWNSNVSSGAGFPDGNLEMDFYGGYKAAFGDFAIDIGAIYYYYPGSDASGLGVGANSGAVNNKELYLGGSWKFLSLKYFYSMGDYFSLRGVDKFGLSTGKNTHGSQYLDLSANYDLGQGWGVNAHLGRLNLKNVYNGDYTDWKVGVTKDVSGWLFALSYIDTNAAGNCGAASYQPYCFTNSNSDSGGVISFGSHTKDAGRALAVLSVSRTF